MAQKLVTRTGTWFRYGDMQLGQGREQAREHPGEPGAVEEASRQNPGRWGRFDGNVQRVEDRYDLGGVGIHHHPEGMLAISRWLRGLGDATTGNCFFPLTQEPHMSRWPLFRITKMKVPPHRRQDR